jgi:putative ABC transport system ATP-binding protein
MGLLRDLHAEGTGVVVITHDRELAASLPRRVTVRDGRITSDERFAGVPA